MLGEMEAGLVGAAAGNQGTVTSTVPTRGWTLDSHELI